MHWSSLVGLFLFSVRSRRLHINSLHRLSLKIGLTSKPEAERVERYLDSLALPHHETEFLADNGNSEIFPVPTNGGPLDSKNHSAREALYSRYTCIVHVLSHCISRIDVHDFDKNLLLSQDWEHVIPKRFTSHDFWVHFETQGNLVYAEALKNTFLHAVDDGIAGVAARRVGDGFELKSHESATRKLGSERKYDPVAALKDILRTTVVVDHAHDVGQTARSLMKHFASQGWKMKVKNMWSGLPWTSGYVGVHINVQLQGKPGQTLYYSGESSLTLLWPEDAMVIAEMQVHLKTILEAKEVAHVAYEHGRRSSDDSDANAASLAIFSCALEDTLSQAQKEEVEMCV